MKKFFLLSLTILMSIILIGCYKIDNEKIDYRKEMRNFVEEIAKKARNKNSNFIVIQQNGEEVIYEKEGLMDENYIETIDGISREDLFYGYKGFNKKTPEKITEKIKSTLKKVQQKGKIIFVVDYCNTKWKIEDSIDKNLKEGFVPFVAVSRDLNLIPDYDIPNENDSNIENIQQVRNFLSIINPENYENKNEFLEDLKNTNYDLIIIDAFFDKKEYTQEEIQSIKVKKNGGKRLIIAYMSIGEAEDYRYYWKDEWYENPPEWLDKENPNWEGNYKVKYWYSEWKNIIFDYLDKIINMGFDGVYLDIIDAYEYFENKEGGK